MSRRSMRVALFATLATVAASKFSTSSVGAGKDRVQEFVTALTSQPVSGSAARAVHSTGGAAGGVVSEGQGYGLLLAGAMLAALEKDDVERQQFVDLSYQMFLGWRRMCERSASSGSCQEDEGFLCGGGRYPCLPHWKFDDDLTAVLGTGSAADGDADALAGMLMAVMAVESDASRPEWYAEMGQWAYDTCIQFYNSCTKSSVSGQHRIVTLGSCWGGWNGEGQNPSYHAPGVYRLCKVYMVSHDEQFGSSASQGDDFASKWAKVIDTSYKMLAAVQCPSTGLIPNWAKVSESSGGSSLTAATGFSGSGTPGAEYGSEASRGTWRVVLDYLLFPDSAAEAAQAFLMPIADQLENKEDGGNWASNLDIDSSCLVSSIHSSWSWNMFMFSPTVSSLVCPGSMSSSRQQDVLDAAGNRIADSAIDHYYSGSWVAISTLTLNGDFALAASNLGLRDDAIVPAPVPVPAPSMTPSPTPSSMPVPSTTMSTSLPPGSGCCSWDKNQGCQDDGGFCKKSQANCEGPCAGMWLTSGGVQSTTSTTMQVATTPSVPVPAPTPAPMPVPVPVPTLIPAPTPDSTCAQHRDQCGGQSWQGATCCVPGLKCEAQSQWYSKCVVDDDSSYGCSQLNQQCGGRNWVGFTCCAPGLKCKESNAWYSQCSLIEDPPSLMSLSSLGKQQPRLRKPRRSMALAFTERWSHVQRHTANAQTTTNTASANMEL